MSMQLDINPRFERACPQLTPDEFNKLTENILNDGGIFDPLIVWGDTIIDGHNRYEISQQYDLPFNTKEIEFESEEDAIIWIKEHQLGTRNLTDAQKWTLIQDIKKLTAERGRQKQSETHIHKQHDTVLSSVDKTSEPINTQKEIADKLGWSSGKVAQAQYVDSHAPEDIKEQVYAGNKSFHKAYTETKEKKSDTGDALMKRIQKKYEEINRDMQKVADKMDNLNHEFEKYGIESSYGFLTEIDFRNSVVTFMHALKRYTEMNGFDIPDYDEATPNKRTPIADYKRTNDLNRRLQEEKENR